MSWLEQHHVKIVVAYLLLLPCAIWSGIRLARADFASQVGNAAHWFPANSTQLRQLKQFSQFSDRRSRNAILVSWVGFQPGDQAGEQFCLALLSPQRNGRTNRKLIENAQTFESVVEEIQSTHPEFARRDAEHQLENILVGSDRQHAALLVTLSEPGMSEPDTALARIHSVAAEVGLGDDSLILIGHPVYVATVNGIVDQLIGIRVPLLVLICSLTAWCCLAKPVYLGVLFVHATTAAAFGLILVDWCGAELDPMLTMLPALWFVLSLSGGVHLINYFREYRDRMAPGKAARLAMRVAWKPCSLATVTTCIGLGSLCTAEILPVWRFGFFGAGGLLLGLLVQFTLLPALILTFSKCFSSPGRGDAIKPRMRFWQPIMAFSYQFRFLIAGVAAASLIVGAVGLPRIHVSNKLSAQFVQRSQIHQDLSWYESHIGPTIPIDVLIRFDLDQAGRLYQRFQLVDLISKRLERSEQWQVLSVNQLLPPMPNRSTIRQIFRRNVYESRIRKRMPALNEAGFVFDHQREHIWRISVLVPNRDTVPLAEIEREIQHQVQRSMAAWLATANTADMAEPKITLAGRGSIMARINQNLSTALGDSCWMTIGLVAIVVVLFLKSIRLGLIAMVPNLFPLILTFGTLGWFSPQIDLGSIMTASIAIGISVDDTVHFMTWYQRGRRRGLPIRTTMERTFQHCAGSIMSTSLIIGLGMLVYVNCPLLPVSRFGGLMFGMLFLAMIGDLILLPALLFVFESTTRARRQD